MRAGECLIVDSNIIEKAFRPVIRFDGFQNHGFAFAAD